MKTTKSWYIDKTASNWRHILFPPRATAHKAVIVFEAGNCLGLFGPQTALNKLSCVQGTYRFHFVPLGRRTVRFDEPVSAEETGIAFTVHIGISYRVADAVTIAQDDSPDLDADVKERVRGLMHHYDGKYTADNWLSLQQALQQRLHRPHLGLGVEVENVVVWVQSVVGKQGKILEATEAQTVVRARPELTRTQIRPDNLFLGDNSLEGRVEMSEEEADDSDADKLN